MNAKVALRNHYRTIRSGLEPETAKKLCRAAQNCLLLSDIWKNSRNIGLFASMPEEISTDRLIQEALSKTGTVWLPRIVDLKNGRMCFEKCHNLHELTLGSHGIREPARNHGRICESGRAFHPDLLVVPGLAFDFNGTRLGYGGGFYDRILAHYRDCISIGFCYSCQLADNLPMHQWDIPVKYICTEKGFMCL